MYIVPDLLAGARREPLAAQQRADKCRDSSSGVLIGTIRVEHPQPGEVQARVGRHSLRQETRRQLRGSVESRRSSWAILLQITDLAIVLSARSYHHYMLTPRRDQL